MGQQIEIRFAWWQHGPYTPLTDLTVDIADDEWIINVESVPPNPSTGSGTRVWIARLAS